MSPRRFFLNKRRAKFRSDVSQAKADKASRMPFSRLMLKDRPLYKAFGQPLTIGSRATPGCCWLAAVKLRPCLWGPSMTIAGSRGLRPNFKDTRSFPERRSTIGLGCPGPIRQWRTGFLFDYEVFPPWIMRFDAEWKKAGRKMATGDLIIQRALMPPIGFGLCLEFAVRIREIFDQLDRLGFSYETLEGHAEGGVSEFSFCERDGGIQFEIHTLSGRGNWLARAAKDVATLPYQAWCTQRALKAVARRFHLENSLPLPA